MRNIPRKLLPFLTRSGSAPTGITLHVDHSFYCPHSVSDNMHENMIKSTLISLIKQMFHALRRTQKPCKIPKTFRFLLKTRTTSGFFPCMFCCLAHFGHSWNFRHLNRKTFPSISTIFQVPPTPANYPNYAINWDNILHSTNERKQPNCCNFWRECPKLIGFALSLFRKRSRKRKWPWFVYVLVRKGHNSLFNKPFPVQVMKGQLMCVISAPMCIGLLTEFG